ncbi:MAG: hypothetical protein Kow0062_10730 [Acidobacteriota bacterium]
MHDQHDRRFSGRAERLRSPERIALLDVDRVVELSLDGIDARRVLDVGTGTGLFAEAFARRGLEVAGIDPSESFLELASRHVPDGTFRAGAAESIPFDDRSFDVVFLGHVLHEVDDPVRALREAGRVARRRVVVLEWPHVVEDQGPPLEHRLTRQAVERAAREAGLGPVEFTRLPRMELYRWAIPQGRGADA